MLYVFECFATTKSVFSPFRPSSLQPSFLVCSKTERPLIPASPLFRDHNHNQHYDVLKIESSTSNFFSHGRQISVHRCIFDVAGTHKPRHHGSSTETVSCIFLRLPSIILAGGMPTDITCFQPSGNVYGVHGQYH